MPPWRKLGPSSVSALTDEALQRCTIELRCGTSKGFSRVEPSGSSDLTGFRVRRWLNAVELNTIGEREERHPTFIEDALLDVHPRLIGSRVPFQCICIHLQSEFLPELTQGACLGVLIMVDVPARKGP